MRGGGGAGLASISKRASRRRRGAATEDQRKAREMLGVPMGEGGGRAPAVAEPRTEEAIAAVRGRIAPFRYLCVVDVEATCENGRFKDFVHEIIELPVVLVDLHSLAVVDEFQSFVRPTVNSTLTAFCTELTGIRQAQVDAAPTLPEVLAQIDVWLAGHGLEYTNERRDFAFAADGPWDLQYFLDGECQRKGIRKPAYFDKWVNVKELFSDFYRVRQCKIHKMLEKQGMRFEGRLHSGIDDTRNIARIAIQMARDGCRMYLNQALPARRQAGAVAKQAAEAPQLTALRGVSALRGAAGATGGVK